MVVRRKLSLADLRALPVIDICDQVIPTDMVLIPLRLSTRQGVSEVVKLLFIAFRFG